MTESSMLLGAYGVLRKTAIFPFSFWAVLEQDGQILIETDEGIRWVKAEEIERACQRGDLTRVD